MRSVNLTFLSFVLLFTLIIPSCGKKDISNDNGLSNPLNSTAACEWDNCLTPDRIGTEHNAMLSYVDANLTDNDNNSLEQLTAVESNLIMDYFAAHPLCRNTPGNSDVFTAVNHFNQYYLNYYNAHGHLDPSAVALHMLDEVRDDLQGNPTIVTTAEMNFLNHILDIIEQTETNGNQSEYPTIALTLEDEWNTQQFNICSNEGYLSKIAISILKNSADFWASYCPGCRMLAIPAWAALDVIGGLAGGISSKASGSSWGQAGMQALIWGASASIPGTRWFKKMFP